MSTDLLTLQDELTRLTVAPEIGASLVNWVRLSDERPLLRPSDEQALAETNPRRLACYPLAPWSNRIGGGGFECPDGWLALAPNTGHEPLPIHGSAWQQPWQVASRTARSAVLQLHSEHPFPYQARLNIDLNAGRLSLQLHVTHLGERPVWYGLGLHPYFPRSANTSLQASAAKVWLCGPDKLSSQCTDIPPNWNFDNARALPDDTPDNAFTQWPGTARIIEAEAGYQLECQAEGVDYYLLFCPREQNFFCFEPVTHPVNAHNLPGRPGLRLLEQNESCQLSFSLQYRTLPAD